jgi:hypothetical protein
MSPQRLNLAKADCGPDQHNGGRSRAWDKSFLLLLVLIGLTVAMQSGCARSIGTSSSTSSLPSIAVQPVSQLVAPGQTATFEVSASGTGPLSYQWLRDGIAIAGAVSASYTDLAAATSDSGEVFAVIVSNSKGSATSAPASLTVNPQLVTITINPPIATLTYGRSQQFMASVTGPASTAVTWTISGSGCPGAACGTISEAGLYLSPTTPPSPASFTVVATSVSDPTKSAKASLTIVVVASVLLSLNPMTVNVPTSGTQLFTASVTGTSDTAVSWSLSGPGCSGSACGSLATSLLSAVYVAPLVAPFPPIVSVLATSLEDPTKSESAEVTIVPTVDVAVSPSAVLLNPGAIQQLDAMVTGTSNTSVKWALSGAGCSGTACGTITGSGIYSAPLVAPSPDTILVTATSVADPTKFASVAVTIAPVASTTYYLAPAVDGGADSNSGTIPGSPWLSPNHPLKCGDTIVAAVSNAYSASNFQAFGTVTCSAGNNVAWLTCARFDGCKISGLATLQRGMTVSASYWGVAGWEVDGTSISSVCFEAMPNPAAPTIHHIIFANNIAVGCGLGGIEFAPAASGGTANGVDYIAAVGNIAYGNSGGSSSCGSGIIVYEPVASDSRPGTHIYVAGNFAWANVNGNPCGGTAPTDGEGIIFDTFDGSQSTGFSPYDQQAVADNNMLLDNGGRGLEVLNNNAASVYLRRNTAWGNNTDLNQTSACACVLGEMLIVDVTGVQVFQNIAVTSARTGTRGYPLYAYWVTSPTGTDSVYQDVGYAANGAYSNKYDPAGLFSYNPNNLFGTNPSFANATIPVAPSCGGASSVENCMTKVIADFTPTIAAASSYGYQVPSATSTYDPLFPQWLCNANLPEGVITMGCSSQ